MTTLVLVSAAALGWTAAWPAPQREVRCRTIRCAEAADDWSHTQTTSLLAQFELGVTQQRAGDADGALQAYSVFVSAAEQHGAPPATFAEVLVNMGTIHAQRRETADARASFERALEHRALGSAHVNLALLCLAEGAAGAAAEGRKGSMPVSAVEAATRHCRSALELNDDPRSVATAERLLGDMARR